MLISRTDTQGMSLMTPISSSLLIMAHSTPLSLLHYLLMKNTWVDIAHDFNMYHFALTIFVSLLAAICAQDFPNTTSSFGS